MVASGGVEMHKKISWTERCEDGVKREVRAEVRHRAVKWQFKRKDDERWDYDSSPSAADWDALEDILKRRRDRGRGGTLLESVRKLRARADV